ncbi:MAG: hypothetical protein HYZ65_14020 [Burkholderiales bacterium]|nr:hypothetical protein [Burkholderiales bacterium]
MLNKKFLMAMLAGVLLAAPLHAQTPADEYAALSAQVKELATRHADLQTAGQAEAALQETGAAQSRLQAWYAQAERACHAAFFVNSCLGDIKLQRRQQQTVLQKITLEAKALQRRLHIEQLDRALQQKQSE